MYFFKKLKNKILLCVIFFFYFIVFSINAFFLTKDEIKLSIVNYQPKINIYIDRKYTNTINDSVLKNNILIQQPRHNNKNIRINVNKPIIIFRVLCAKNDYRYYSHWNIIKIKIKIKGVSCTHSKIVQKKFYAGLITLLSGGPTASDPIFIKVIEENTEISLF